MRIKFFDKTIKDDGDSEIRSRMLDMLRKDLKGEHDAVDLYNKHIDEFNIMKENRIKYLEENKKDIEYDIVLEMINDNITQETHIRDEELEHIEELEKVIHYTETGEASPNEEDNSRE